MIKVGRWYWTREGLVAWAKNRYSHPITYPFFGYILWADGEDVYCSFESWTEKGELWAWDEDHDLDLICEPASRERIVFPNPATCPRWFKGSALEAARLRRVEALQGESEEVLFT